MREGWSSSLLLTLYNEIFTLYLYLKQLNKTLASFILQKPWQVSTIITWEKLSPDFLLIPNFPDNFIIQSHWPSLKTFSGTLSCGGNKQLQLPEIFFYPGK